MKKLDKVSIAETIEKYGKGKMKLILELLPRVTTTVNDLSKISTGESFRASQANLRRGSSPVGYPKGGLVSLSNIFTNEIKRNDGQIYLGKKVKQIIIDGGKASGIIVDDNEYKFDIVVSNILVQYLFNIASEKHQEGYDNRHACQQDWKKPTGGNIVGFLCLFAEGDLLCL